MNQARPLFQDPAHAPCDAARSETCIADPGNDTACSGGGHDHSGDSGRIPVTIDRIEGFDSGLDRTDMRAFGRLIFEQLDHADVGASRCYDGRFLRIDAHGDCATDMMVQFAWVDALIASDFVLLQAARRTASRSPVSSDRQT